MSLRLSAFNIPNIHTVMPRDKSVCRPGKLRDYALENSYLQFLERFLPASVVLNEVQ